MRFHGQIRQHDMCACDKLCNNASCALMVHARSYFIRTRHMVNLNTAEEGKNVSAGILRHRHSRQSTLFDVSVRKTDPLMQHKWVFSDGVALISDVLISLNMLLTKETCLFLVLICSFSTGYGQNDKANFNQFKLIRMDTVGVFGNQNSLYEYLLPSKSELIQ
jgi:hypothetical protein